MMTEYKKCKSEEGNLGRRAGHAVKFPMFSGNQIKGKTRETGQQEEAQSEMRFSGAYQTTQ